MASCKSSEEKANSKSSQALDNTLEDLLERELVDEREKRMGVEAGNAVFKRCSASKCYH